MDEKKIYDKNAVLTAAMDIGEQMVCCGAEISRVEDTITRICNAYEIGTAEVFSITNLIIVSIHTTKGEPLTQIRRIYQYSTSLGRLEKLNALSRELCRTTPDPAIVSERIQNILKKSDKLSWRSGLGYVLTGSAFTVFFGGTAIDALASIPIALIQFLMDSLIKRRGANRLIYTFLTSLISAAMVLIFVFLGFGRNTDKIMIGVIMPLIPGLQFTNSLREMFCGDIMSGFMRLLEAILLAVTIALGFAVPLLITGRLHT